MFSFSVFVGFSISKYLCVHKNNIINTMMKDLLEVKRISKLLVQPWRVHTTFNVFCRLQIAVIAAASRHVFSNN